MYILTKNDNSIMYITKTLKQQPNGDYLINNDSLIIPSIFVKISKEFKKLDDNIVPDKYCYTEEEGFYKNPNWQPPMPSDETRITELEVAITELYEMILGGM